LEDGDIISIDVDARRLDVELDERELKRRLESWKPPKPKIGRGWLLRYSLSVSSANTGAIIRPGKI